MPAPARPVIMVHTADRARALPFWRDVMGAAFGLRLVAEDPFAAVFDLDGVQVRLSDVPDWTAHPHTILGLDVPDLDRAMDTLAAHGVTFQVYDGFGQDARGVWTAPDGAIRLAWFLDPDGNNLSVSQGVTGQR